MMTTKQSKATELAIESSRNITNGNITDAVYNLVEAGIDDGCIVDEEKFFAVAYAAICAYKLLSNDGKQTLLGALGRRAF